MKTVLIRKQTDEPTQTQRDLLKRHFGDWEELILPENTFSEDEIELLEQHFGKKGKFWGCRLVLLNPSPFLMARAFFSMGAWMYRNEETFEPDCIKVAWAYVIVRDPTKPGIPDGWYLYTGL